MGGGRHTEPFLNMRKSSVLHLPMGSPCNKQRCIRWCYASSTLTALNPPKSSARFARFGRILWGSTQSPLLNMGLGVLILFTIYRMCIRILCNSEVFWRVQEGSKHQMPVGLGFMNEQENICSWKRHIYRWLFKLSNHLSLLVWPEITAWLILLCKINQAVRKFCVLTWINTNFFYGMRPQVEAVR